MLGIGTTAPARQERMPLKQERAAPGWYERGKRVRRHSVFWVSSANNLISRTSLSGVIVGRCMWVCACLFQIAHRNCLRRPTDEYQLRSALLSKMLTLRCSLSYRVSGIVEVRAGMYHYQWCGYGGEGWFSTSVYAYSLLLIAPILAQLDPTRPCQSTRLGKASSSS